MKKGSCNIESLAKYIWKLNNVLSDEKDNMCIRFAGQLPLNYFPGETDRCFKGHIICDNSSNGLFRHLG